MEERAATPRRMNEVQMESAVRGSGSVRKLKSDESMRRPLHLLSILLSRSDACGRRLKRPSRTKATVMDYLEPTRDRPLIKEGHSGAAKDWVRSFWVSQEGPGMTSFANGVTIVHSSIGMILCPATRGPLDDWRSMISRV